MTEVLLDDLIARGRLSSRDIPRDRLAKVRRALPRAKGAARARVLTRALPSAPARPARLRAAAPLLQMLVSEYIRFPQTNASFPLNFCLVYDFMPTAVQSLMSPHCMTA